MRFMGIQISIIMPKILVNIVISLERDLCLGIVIAIRSISVYSYRGYVSSSNYRLEILDIFTRKSEPMESHIKLVIIGHFRMKP